MKRKILSLFLIFGLILTFSTSIYAAKKDGVEYYIYKDGDKISIQVMSERRFDNKDYEINIKYYDCSDDLIDSEVYEKRNTDYFKKRVRPPRGTDHETIRIIANGKIIHEAGYNF
ncbi:MAG: hypothetical protein N4A63_12390 [Vallitalea sp.]|jgi:hypothetical protein|nr:hypothetical protein [Vallitalea sp.]